VVYHQGAHRAGPCRRVIDDDHGGQATGTVTVTVLPEPGVVVGGTLYTVKDVSPEGMADPVAWGINDAGQIAASGTTDAIRTTGFKIDDAGVIVGQVQLTAPENSGDGQEGEDEGEEPEKEGPTLGFIRASDGTIAIFSIPGSLNTFLGDINNHGQIVGGFSVDAGDEALLFGFVRNADGTFSAFTVPNEEGSPLWTKADDINDAGEIVGLFRPDAGAEVIQGFLRNADGTILCFKLPDFEEVRFTDINNRGVISGFGIDAEGVFHAVVLTPISPAPNTSFEDTDGGDEV
jgi:hypothetical protein